MVELRLGGGFDKMTTKTTKTTTTSKQLGCDLIVINLVFAVKICFAGLNPPISSKQAL